MSQKNKVIEFLRKKDFKFIQELSNGSFGRTILLEDGYIDHQFVCKKYEPLDGIPKEDYYDNFVNEIKLLHLLYHENIVRVFNYYLYPELYTGYIMMEYINGMDMYAYIEQYPENINSIFEQTINGFIYLEENNILHRDIRPSNILVDNNNNVKIIDFGFGKRIHFVEDNEKSISINWWGDEKPDEFESKIYDKKTEIFFIGKLFEELLYKVTTSFKYKAILKKMINTNYTNRFDSFKSIKKELKASTQYLNPFNKEEKKIYKDFSSTLFGALSGRESESSLIMDNGHIIQNFEHLQKKIMLEDYVNAKHVLSILIKGAYTYYNNPQYFNTNELISFFSFFKSLSLEKQNMVLYGLEINFDEVEVYIDVLNDDIPF